MSSQNRWIGEMMKYMISYKNLKLRQKILQKYSRENIIPIYDKTINWTK